MSLIDQLGHPRGWVGALLLPMLNIGNRRLMGGALDLADLQHGERVLDVGFGGGALLRHARKRTQAPVYGLDRSAIATRRGGAKIAAVQGDVARPPFADDVFDVIFVINVVYFLPKPAAALTALTPMLTQRGRIIIGCELRDPLGVAWSLDTLADLVRDAGLTPGVHWDGGAAFAISAARRPPLTQSPD